MNRRTILCGVSSGLAASLAGCAGILDDGPDRESDGEPDAYTETGADLSEDTLRSSHEAALREAGSFTAQQDLRVDGESASESGSEDGTFESSSTYRMDLDREVYLRESESSMYEAVMTTYSNGSNTYTEWNPANEEPTYSNETDNPIDPIEGMGRDMLISDGVAFEQAGVEQYNGLWVTRYEAAGADAVQTDAHSSEFGSDDITEFESTLLVTPEGIAVSNEFSITFENDNGAESRIEYTHKLRNIGETEVEEPQWAGTSDSTDE